MDSDYVPDENSISTNKNHENECSSSRHESSGLNRRKRKEPVKTTATASTTKKVTKSNKNQKNSKMSTSSIYPEHVDDIKQVFKRFDTENKGQFDIKQLKFAMRAMGFEPKNEEVKRITDEYNKDGFILYDDFLELMIKKINEKTINDEIMKAFQLFDTSQNGKITFDNLRHVANELGEKITDNELMEMIDEADLNGDKAVDSQEFLRIMKKTFLY